MKRVIIINGPNLNLLGKREPDFYGVERFESFFKKLKKKYFSGIEIISRQSNHEGSIVDLLQEVGFSTEVGIVLNAGAYTHTSIAISDAIRSIPAKVIEVHMTNIYAREPYRKQSFISSVCDGSICGFGLRSYELAIMALI
ncbi:MAG TPA: type II 3-dehydroquinate dehydratase [Blattabacteriaceae bacterium]